MFHDRAHLIPFFSKFGNPQIRHNRKTLARCLFCSAECVDFVPTDAGFACHPCVAVCVEFTLSHLRDSQQMQLNFDAERAA